MHDVVSPYCFFAKLGGEVCLRPRSINEQLLGLHLAPSLTPEWCRCGTASSASTSSRTVAWLLPVSSHTGWASCVQFRGRKRPKRHEPRFAGLSSMVLKRLLQCRCGLGVSPAWPFATVQTHADVLRRFLGGAVAEHRGVLCAATAAGT